MAVLFKADHDFARVLFPGNKITQLAILHDGDAHIDQSAT